MNTIYDTFISIFGEYQPCSVLIDETNNIYETSINWGYIGAVLAFLVLFYCALRIVGAVLCNKG